MLTMSAGFEEVRDTRSVPSSLAMQTRAYLSVSPFEIPERLNKWGTPLSLPCFSASSGEHHTMWMFVGKVSSRCPREEMRIRVPPLLLPFLPVLMQCFHSKGHDHTTFNDVFSPDSPGVRVARNGWGNFTCARGGIAVWTLASKVAACG